MDVYFPNTFVKQSALETHDGVSAGKYTKGLEQEAMSFCGDREDINSMCMTVTESVLSKYGIKHSDIGRLEVGTETLLDKSKSIKTTLMTLFEKSGNFNIEGIDSVNACYGGTAALFNSINWIESSNWDGRYALVVTGDIAVYAAGNARPTGGAGVVAMLVGPNAPIVMERGLRGSHFENAYDFYKPNMESEYPVVDGQLSITCYFRALDNCYNLYKGKYASCSEAAGKAFTVDNADHAIFHSPFLKLVRKSFARLVYQDFLKDSGSNPRFSKVSPQLKTLSAEESYNSKDVANVFGDLSTPLYTDKVEPCVLLPKQLGNTYTASLYCGLLSLIAEKPTLQNGKRVVMFSYGSGLAATMFSLRIGGSVEKIAKLADVKQRLNKRIEVSPAEYTKVLAHKEQTYNSHSLTPQDSIERLSPGTFYLEKVDQEKRRFYKRKN